MDPSRSTRALLVALSVIGAGLIHLAAIRSHLGSPVAVASFTGIGLVQVLVGASLLQGGPDRMKRAAVVGVGTLAVATWLISRTWGLPAVSGHSGAETVGPADLAAAVLQLIGVAVILLPDRSPRPESAGRLRSGLVALPVITVSAIASVSLMAVPPHAHEPQRDVRPAAYESGQPLVKRAVPIPGSAPEPHAGHTDAPGAAPHSH
ncbi:MAG TPA: hypothetical protein VMY88_07070 [Acidimicrobiales bacterium]|nr:hypothetical protein [Acidimicrobiales bacterium]